MMIMGIIKEVLGVGIYDLIAQGFGIAGIGVLLFAFMQKDDIRTQKLVTLALFVWLAHYLMLELTGAVYASLIGLLRMYFSFKHKGNKWALSFTFFVTGVAGIYAYDGIVSVLPIIASFVAILAFQVFNGFTMRVALLITSMLRLYYMIIQQSVPGIVNEILSIIILVVTLIKIYLDEHKDLSLSRTLIEKIKYTLSSRKIRKRRDFGRFMIFRDRKKYLEDNNIVYED